MPEKHFNGGHDTMKPLRGYDNRVLDFDMDDHIKISYGYDPDSKTMNRSVEDTVMDVIQNEIINKTLEYKKF